MPKGLERNSPHRRRREHRWRSRSRSSSRSPSPAAKGQAIVEQPQPRPYMKQVKLHPSGCQQWASQVVSGGGIYMAYASTLTTYVYDVRDYSLVTILGGNDCNVHSVLWHPYNSHRLVVFSTDGRGSEWDVTSEERVSEFEVGASPACSAWDPSNVSNLAVVAKGSNATHLLGDRGGRTGYTRRPGNESHLTATCAKWSRYKPGTLVVGWTDGRVSFSETSSTLSGGANSGRSKLTVPKEEAGAVVDLRHDPHGGAYVLVAYSSGSVVLWDVAAHSCMATFERCAVGLVGVRWMAWAPGNFLALSSKTGIARVFNISQNNAIGTVRLGETGSGIRDMAWLPSQATLSVTAAAVDSSGPRAICGFRDGSLSVADTGFSTSGIGVGSRNGVSFGGGSGHLPWSSKAGHIETVFTCAHRPGDPNTLATGSYGSSVKVWHTPTMDLKVTLTGQTGAIYSVAWSLDGERIASSSGEGTVWIWDAESGKAEQRLHLHSRAAHRVQWDPFCSTRLASAGADKRLVIFSDNGAVERTYDHPAALYGCHWCPSWSDVIATGCLDGNVRVFDVFCKARTAPQYLLSGHSRRVFNVCWSPLLHATLASGSDDSTIIIWCLGVGTSPRSDPAGGTRLLGPSAVLHGHTSNVRPLHWNTEVPWLLLSGSWDGTIRAWDIRRAGIGRKSFSGGKVDPDGDARDNDQRTRGSCIAIMRDHVADVYGLSAADDRPFLYVSASRDTTLRQFTLEGVVSSLKTRAVVGNTLAKCLGDAKEAMHQDSPAILCGQAARALQVQLHEFRQDGASLAKASRRLFDFFWGSDGVDEFWEVLRWVEAAMHRTTRGYGSVEGPDTLAEFQQGGHQQPRIERGARHTGPRGNEDSRNGAGGTMSGKQTTISLRDIPRGLMLVEDRVLHRDARRPSARELARRLEQSLTFLIQDRRLVRCDRLERAAQLYVALGDLRSSCDALITLGRWERALSIAAGRGMEYWKKLADRYAEFILAGGAPGRSRSDNRGSSVQQGGSDDQVTVAVSLLAATGRPLEALEILKGSDEAFTFAISVADGAYAPTLQESSLWCCPYESMAGSSVNTGRSGLERQEAKLVGLIDEHLGAPDAESRQHGNRQGSVYEGRNASEEEGQASPKHDGSRRNSSQGLAERQQHDARCATQRERAEVALREMTESAAATYFRASQSALAAATLLSLCDGTRAAVAPALYLLVRGEEPELAFAAARALRFPAGELCPLIREMARRAEAWGDPSLAVELLLNSGGDDADNDGDNSSNATNTTYEDYDVTDLGQLPFLLYGTAGEEAGPRGAARVASRAGVARDSVSTNTPASGLRRKNSQLALNLRSKSSYLEDAEAALRRGKDVEAVRLLALGADFERAVEHGVSFLREVLSSTPSSPTSRRSLAAASAVTRALGSGPPLMARVSDLLRQQLLAYASYVGARDAISRGYQPIVAPLLRNASVCVQAAERLAINGRKSSGEADEKIDADRDSSPRHSHRGGGHQKHLFPACMSTGALVLAAVRYLAENIGDASPAKQGGVDIAEAEGPCYEHEVALGIARRLREEEELPAEYASAVDGLISSAERRLRCPPPPQISPISAARASVASIASEGKNQDDEVNSGSRPTSFVSPKASESSWATIRVGAGGLLRAGLGEVVVNGSLLPSCRRHERGTWRAGGDDVFCDKGGRARVGDSTSNAPTMTTTSRPPVSRDFGQQIWPLAKGATFWLEDGETGIGLSNAIMWGKVNPFSPLNTGCRIMPF